MKLRSGFVSNSSSSSFVCDVCGDIESGWDISHEEAGMYECENGHVFCETHVIGELPEDCPRYEVPAANCPICSLQYIPEWHLMSYLLKQRHMTKDELINEVKGKFYSFEQLKEYLR